MVHTSSIITVLNIIIGFMKNDPLSEGSPYKAICSREDLMSDNPRAGGCTDTKVCNVI